jgi:hypothetical protein
MVLTNKQLLVSAQVLFGRMQKLTLKSTTNLTRR